EVKHNHIDQFPSPMVDYIRAHERIEKKDVPGVSFVLKDVLSKPVEVYLTDNKNKFGPIDLLIHFHGQSYVPKHAVYDLNHPLLLAVVNLGSGSSVYENAFENQSTFPRLVEKIYRAASEKKAIKMKPARIYLSSFSAGYGAVRAILKKHQPAVHGIVLLDGLHTNYIPPRRVLSQGGKLNDENLRDFIQYARLAMDNKKKLLITHSEIFPGTYASTTETADFLIRYLHLKRRPVLKWGPVGMQMLTETRKEGLTILGFAGNSAPDHIDHYHGLPIFLKIMLNR
ncbi:MAG: hypothetical protein ACYSTT_01755, partial [Planctomycetota bacterium]